MAARPIGSREGQAGSRRLAGPAFLAKRDSERLREERTGEKALCTGVAMRHGVHPSNPSSIWIIH
jgi:hypothetical protein